MTTIFKIRLLLVLLTVCFFVTAITVHFTYDRQVILVQDAKKIEEKLHRKEAIIRDFIQDSVQIQRLYSITPSDRLYVEEMISTLTDQHQIIVHTYIDDQLVFWSSEHLVPEKRSNWEEGGSGLVQMNNGWYYSILHQSGDRAAEFFVLVKSNYQKVNQYLENRFSEDLISTNNLDIADYTDREVYSIRDLSGQYLFSVKMHSQLYDSIYSDLELLMWLLGGVLTLALFHIFCMSLAKSGWAWLSILLFGSFLFLLRMAEIEWNWFATNFNSGIFDPRFYASSEMFPHLGGFLLTLLFITWFLVYVFLVSKWLELPRFFHTQPIGPPALFILCGVALYLFSYFLNGMFDNLVSHSSIHFDVTDMLYLDFYSWIGIGALSVSMLSLLLAIGICIQLGNRVLPNIKHFYRLLTVVFAIFMLALIILDRFTIYFVCFILLFYVLVWYAHFGQKYIFTVSLTVLLLLAGIASLRQSELQQKQRQEAQKMAIQELEDVDDVNALALFLDLEKDIIQDSIIINNFRRPNLQTPARVLDHLKSTYFSGYLSRYEVAVDVYDAQFLPVNKQSTDRLSAYREKVISGAIKVSAYFYRGNSSFGNYEYFAQFPINLGDEFLGMLLVDMSNRTFGHQGSYPGVLADSRLDFRQNVLMSEYSYAFYRSQQLINQRGKYVYPVHDSVYQDVGLREYVQFGNDHGFAHMVYKPDASTTIVLSKPTRGGWMQFASLSFFFLVFLVFFVCVFLLTWLVATLSTNDFSLRNLRWRYLLVSNRILYSTRIQLLIVIAVVFTLIVVGIITFWSVSNQFVKQQENTILTNAWNLTKSFESRLVLSESTIGKDDYEEFQAIAQSNALDLNLYSTSGRLIFTTQPRIYDLQLLSDYINPRAFDHLSHYARSQYLQDEYIGGMEYKAAYTTVRNAEHEPLAYLSLPAYASKLEFERSTGELLNNLINIYTLVILVLGLFAAFVANRITAPLLLVQRSLARTKIGKQNEPIFWKRNDEMGRLIREYNLMIAELEQSAIKIAESERESAWKEMARQVAHEIRNPLTPLKLGIQQLERSWLDKDPGFEERFKRFIDSFVEQIDGLTRIATEFSDFAKMPDAQFSEYDLIEVLRNSVSVFDSYSNVTISMFIPEENEGKVRVFGDRDQLLRTFNNLIKNAIEAASSKRKCLIRITVSIEGEHVLIAVQDNGEGIAPEVRKNLFKPNFTTKSSGTGLGLAFVKRAVDNMGGKVTYKTTLGKGTTFTIKFPRRLI